LAPDEANALIAALERIESELLEGSWRPDPASEDIHMAVEARLIELVGDVGAKLHTARSRNDQVATDVRLWLRSRLDRLTEALRRLVATLVDRAAADGRTLMPGYTHLQRGQPILLGHHLLAHAWALSRDLERISDARRRVDRSPLGACALAGTPHPIDRQLTARLLGFAAPLDNAMDAVAARDHLQETVAVCAILMTHASRMAEELVLWSSEEFAFVRLGDAHVTGSSIMPQKRNPDAAELVRGKTARVYGSLVQLLALVKGLPLAYNRDLQEDRSALFDAVMTTLETVELLVEIWRDLAFDSDRFVGELAVSASLATELADGLAALGVPFREAHGVVARLVKDLEREGRELGSLSAEELTAYDSRFPEKAVTWLDPQAAIDRRTSLGGTAWSEVKRQMALLRDLLGAP
jgi:argininosuccinate lyase